MSKILFLFEGKEYEPDIFKMSAPVIAPGSNFTKDSNGIICEFGTNIYKLYAKLKSDAGFDLIGLLLENPEKYPKLVEVVKDSPEPKEEFEAVYLIFDYDGHVPMPVQEDGTHLDGDETLKEMLAFFNEATGNGKLFISYPMCEAIKHLSAPPESREDIITAKCKGKHCPNDGCKGKEDRDTCPPVRQYYKGLVNRLSPRWRQTARITPGEWGAIFRHHLRVAEMLCLPDASITSQEDIFNIQLRDYISRGCPQVAVLSSFPFMIIDLIGEKRVRARLDALSPISSGE